MSGLEPVGLGYQERLSNGVTLLVNRLREAHGELSAELRITFRGQAPAAPVQHLTTQRVNLLSARSRDMLARYVERRLSHETGGAVIEFSFEATLERFYEAVLAAHRNGGRHPFEVVGGDEEPDDDHPPFILAPLIWAGAPTLVFGAGGRGKSTLAAAAAVSVESGREIVPGWRPLSAPALILDWEDSRSEWDRQIRAIARGAAIQVPTLAYKRMAGSLADQVEEIAAHVTGKAIGLLVVDSVEAACGAGREAEGFNERVERLFAALRHLDVATLLLDHVAGADLDRDGGTPKPYGGVFKLNRVRAAYEVAAEHDPTAGRIEVVLRDVKRNRRARQAPMSVALAFDDFDDYGRAHAIRFERCEITAPELLQTLSRPQQVLQALRGGPLTVSRIAEAVGIKDNHVRSLLTRMAAKGQVTRLNSGLWGRMT